VLAGDLQEQRVGESLGAMGVGVIPITLLRRRGMTRAMQTAIALGLDRQIDGALAARQMAHPKLLTVAVVFGRPPPALVTNGPVLCRLEVEMDLWFIDLGAQYAHSRKI
jgi:hypothetical protein